MHLQPTPPALLMYVRGPLDSVGQVSADPGLPAVAPGLRSLHVQELCQEAEQKLILNSVRDQIHLPDILLFTNLNSRESHFYYTDVGTNSFTAH